LRKKTKKEDNQNKMNEKIKSDLLNVMHQIVRYLGSKDFFGLHELSNHTIHNASIYQDSDSNQLAVITYALSKTIERSKNFDFNKIRKKFVLALEDLEAENVIDYRNGLKSILKDISEIDSKLGLYINEVLEQAKINKGSKIYDHGVSMARASELLGISQWDLMSYIGKTKIADRANTESDVEKRVKAAREIFG
jgi:uncharacterized Zn finger protein